MFELIFLLSLGLVWIIFATVQDVRQREIANWLNFSLIIFALGFRFFYSLFELSTLDFFYHGLIGFGIFFILGNLFYYSKLFAGGDAKLFMALGAILPLTDSTFYNLEGFLYFILIFLIVGAVYGLIFSFYLAFSNFKIFKKEFLKQLRKNKFLVFSSIFFFLMFFLLGFFYLDLLIYLSFFMLAFPFLFLFSKSVDEGCMIKKVKVSELTEGDWLYEDVKVGRKIVRSKWDGLSSGEISLLKKKYKSVKIRQGIQFAPVFLISYLAWVFWFFYFV